MTNDMGSTIKTGSNEATGRSTNCAVNDGNRAIAIAMARKLVEDHAQLPRNSASGGEEFGPEHLAFFASFDRFIEHLNANFDAIPRSEEAWAVGAPPWLYSADGSEPFADSVLALVSAPLLPVYLMKKLIAHYRVRLSPPHVPAFDIYAVRYRGCMLENDQGRLDTPEFAPIRKLLLKAKTPEQQAVARQRYFDWASGQNEVAA